MSQPPLYPDLRLRLEAREQMDEPSCDLDRLEKTLDQFHFINRWISRTPALIARYVLPILEAHPEKEHHLLDLGAGGCDMAVAVLDLARRRGLRLRVTALDSDARIIRFARRRHGDKTGLTILERDLGDWTGLEPVDFVFGNHILHHLTEERILALLRDLPGLNPAGILFSDLERRRWPYLAFYAGGSLLFHRSFTTADGLLSIRRAFTAEELQRLAGLTRAGYRVLRLFPDRLILIRGFIADLRADGRRAP
jgi:hypothetical protein